MDLRFNNINLALPSQIDSGATTQRVDQKLRFDSTKNSIIEINAVDEFASQSIESRPAFEAGGHTDKHQISGDTAWNTNQQSLRFNSFQGWKDSDKKA